MDSPLRRLLWLVDFTLAADSVAACVRWLCTFAGVELHVLYVAPPHLADGIADLIPESTWRDDEAAASDADIHARLERFVRAQYLGSHVTLAVRRGQPAREALRYAGEVNVDLIIMSRPQVQHRPLFEFTGISMRLGTRAPCSVLVIPEARHGGEPEALRGD